VHDSYLCRMRMLRLVSCLALAVLVAVVMAACGGSSKSSSSTGTSTVAKAASTGGAYPGPAGRTKRELEIRGIAMRKCLQKNGVKLPKGTTGPGLPKGVTRAQYKAALKKCGGGIARRGNLASNRAFKQALVKFTACLASNGVKLPAHTGSEPSLNGVNTSTASYRRARAACMPVLTAALKAAAKSSPAPAKPAPPAALTVKVPASVTAILTRFTTCMRAHGVGAFPQPKGATFDMSGTHVDTHSASYKSAEAHCNSILRALDQTG
jgi:hypothetical protein